MLVDDFVGCGSEQILLLPPLEGDTAGQDGCPARSMLTDFGRCHANKLEGVSNYQLLNVPFFNWGQLKGHVAVTCQVI